MEKLDFERNENGNVVCDQNGEKKQSFVQFRPLETKKMIY